MVGKGKKMGGQLLRVESVGWRFFVEPSKIVCYFCVQNFRNNQACERRREIGGKTAV
jgi:hypothetical protein